MPLWQQFDSPYFSISHSFPLSSTSPLLSSSIFVSSSALTSCPTHFSATYPFLILYLGSLSCILWIPSQASRHGFPLNSAHSIEATPSYQSRFYYLSYEARHVSTLMCLIGSISPRCNIVKSRNELRQRSDVMGNMPVLLVQGKCCHRAPWPPAPFFGFFYAT